jgi:hypothetical protein
MGFSIKTCLPDLIATLHIYNEKALVTISITSTA